MVFSGIFAGNFNWLLQEMLSWKTLFKKRCLLELEFFKQSSLIIGVWKNGNFHSLTARSKKWSEVKFQKRYRMFKDYLDFLITVSFTKIVWIALAHPVLHLKINSLHRSQYIIDFSSFRVLFSIESHWDDSATLAGSFEIAHTWAIFLSTGCSIWKLSIVNGCKTETVHFRPFVGEAKMCLRGGRFRLQFSAVCLHFSKNLPPFKHILPLPT